VLKDFWDKVQVEVDAGYIRVEKHPTADLWIYNYTQKAQFEWRWNTWTTVCRGLIVDAEKNILARPFPKFFSYDQLNGQVPNEPFEVFDKLDGSLGILYRVNGAPMIATRGSFVSEMAAWATEKLWKDYYWIDFDPKITYLFEIIYKQNRIVVDYGEVEDLILLAGIETDTGKEIGYGQLALLGMPIVERFDGIRDFNRLLDIEVSNKEGFVVRFESGTRVKLKFEEYKRLHKLLTGINARHIWEMLRDGQPLDALIERVPDEYFAWATGIEKELREQYAAIESEAKANFKPRGDRKETAIYFQTCPNSPILFSMLDGKDYARHIWKLIRPAGEKPFRCDIDA
jgi:hypothetical protein